MGGGGENQQQKSSDQYYQQEAQNANQLMQQYQQYFLPIAQQLIPQLQAAAQGQGPLAQAAMAPVNAQTSRSLNTMQNNIGGYTNADALASDIALNGQTNAGLASDNLIGNSINSLMQLFGMGQNGAGTGMTGLNSAAGGEANLGGQLWNQNNAWWQDALGAAGAYYGMKTGNYQNQPTEQSQSPYANPTTPFNITANTPGWSTPANPFLQMAPGTSVTDGGVSTPASSNGPHSGLPGFGPG